MFAEVVRSASSPPGRTIEPNGVRATLEPRGPDRHVGIEVIETSTGAIVVAADELVSPPMVPDDERGSPDLGRVTVSGTSTATLDRTAPDRPLPDPTPDLEGEDEDDEDDDFESLLRQVARAPSVDSLPLQAPQLAPGTIVDDCFRIVRALGRGGMGVVYLADHLQLERQVALKLHSVAAGSAGTSRLVREARTMARLVHDNVITVYDVGTVDRQVYIAMEYVDGGTVRDWLDRQPRPWSEVVRVFIAAGRGLAAAHQAGLVHRDFKPDNVLVGLDGRVRVADFGLARAAEGDDGVPLRWRDGSRPTPSGAFAALTTEQGLRLTATGALVGTPAYMAPEQHEGRGADARSDQFAYCVSLYEALYGERPFSGRTLMELVDHVVEGEPVEPPSERDIPPFVRDALRRGLSRDPSARFPSMEDLVRALEHDPAAARRRWLGLGLAVVTVSVAVGIAQQIADEDPCAGGRSRLSDVWDANRGDRLEQALTEHGGPVGVAVAARVRARLDRYGDDWIDAYREACEATHRRQVQSAEALDLRMACLDVRREEVAALSEVLAEGDADVAAQADRASLSLSSLVPCADVDALRRVEPIAQDDRPAAEVLRRTLARAKEELDAGRYAIASSIADQGLTDAQALGYVSLNAEALHWVAEAHTKLGRHDASSEAMERSFAAAVAGGDDRLALRSVVALIYTDGYQRADSQLGERWLRQADAWLLRVQATGMPVVRRNLYAGLMRREQGQLDAAVEFMQRALDAVDALEGDRALDARQSVVASLAVTLRLRGDIEGSLAAHAEAMELAESLFGPTHPSLATELNNAAGAAMQQGDLERSEQLLRRALEIRTASFGPDHPSVLEARVNMAMTLAGLQRADEAIAILRAAEQHATQAEPRVRAELHASLGSVYSEQGRHDDAAQEFDRARAVALEALTPDDPTVLRATTNLANLANRRERPAEAAAYAREGLRAIGSSSREGLDFVEGYLRLNLADALYAQSEHEDAREQYERALALMEANLGADHPHLHAPLFGVAQCWFDAGEPAKAEPPLRRALALAGRLDPGTRASTRLLLAEVLWDQGAREPAREVAQQAKDDPDAPAERVEAIDRWLRSHPG